MTILRENIDYSEDPLIIPQEKWRKFEWEPVNQMSRFSGVEQLKHGSSFYKPD